MTQEYKELLLQDLCGRIPYGVKMNHVADMGNNPVALIGIAKTMITLESAAGYGTSNIEDYIPYLFPLSSMNEEQIEEVHNLIYQGVSESVDETKEWLKTRKENELRPITLTYILSYKLVIDWFCKNHFDYRGFIPKGLAIDATGLNIY